MNNDENQVKGSKNFVSDNVENSEEILTNKDKDIHQAKHDGTFFFDGTLKYDGSYSADGKIK